MARFWPGMRPLRRRFNPAAQNQSLPATALATQFGQSEGKPVTLPNAVRTQALIAHLAAAGYPRCEPPLLQPASVFLDLSGEDLRGRLYLTQDASGTELCLRPEFTIPVCRDWLASKRTDQPAGFSYLGPVFRARPDAPGEFVQAGLESFGRADHAAADAEILSVALESAAAAGCAPLAIKLGDADLFAAMIAALDVPAVWQRRILRGHARGLSLAAVLDAVPPADSADHSGVLAALQGADQPGARALVQDLLNIAGIATVGGRTAGEIADRYLEQAALRGGGGFPLQKRQLLERFLAISGDPDQALHQLRALATEAGLDLGRPLDEFDARIGFMFAHGLDVSTVGFATAFARNLDYYTGFVFEARVGGKPASKPVIGGGRYDRLLASLNGGHAVPAVGAAIWMDRLLEHAA